MAKIITLMFFGHNSTILGNFEQLWDHVQNPKNELGYSHVLAQYPIFVFLPRFYELNDKKKIDPNSPKRKNFHFHEAYQNFNAFWKEMFTEEKVFLALALHPSNNLYKTFNLFCYLLLYKTWLWCISFY